MSRTIYFEANVLSGGLRSPGVAVPFAGVDSIRTGGAALRSGERHDEIPHRFVLFLLQPDAGPKQLRDATHQIYEEFISAARTRL